MKYEIEFIHKSWERRRNKIYIFGDRDAVSAAKICFMIGKEPEYVDFVIRKIKEEGE